MNFFLSLRPWKSPAAVMSSSRETPCILHVTSLGLYMKNINNVALHSIAVKYKRPFQRDRTSTGLEVERNM